MGWRKVSEGLAGQKTVRLDNNQYQLVKKDAKINGSDLIGYVYRNKDEPHDHIMVASNGMCIVCKAP
jgi:ribosomal protein L14